MAFPKFIEIDGKRHLWRELLQRRREQLLACAKGEQPPLFELKGRIIGPKPTACRRALPRTLPLSEADLSRFTGSENWYRHGIVRNVLFTDGAKYVAD